MKCSKVYARYLILLFLRKDYLLLDINLLYSGNLIEWIQKKGDLFFEMRWKRLLNDISLQYVLYGISKTNFWLYFSCVLILGKPAYLSIFILKKNLNFQMSWLNINIVFKCIFFFVLKLFYKLLRIKHSYEFYDILHSFNSFYDKHFIYI